ncbi:MAG: 50S ribosomal protein L10 [Propionibacteriaceae bacterium]|jgi:large subunit ribosomal protein L10|nr:50S ribosomal protein L10 [Propionibacteriaceae bacterium]
MARPDKVAEVESLAGEFTSSVAAVLTEYRGLSVKNLKELRRSLDPDASYAVAKNTLTRIAAQSVGIEGLDDVLVGPTAIAFIKGDVATVAKGLRDFAKANPLLVIKGGIMDGKVLDADTVKKLADLESREVLLAKLAGAVKGSAQKAVSLFAAPLTQAAQLFGAYQDKLSADQKLEEATPVASPVVDAANAGSPAPETSDIVSAPADAGIAASNE